MNCFLQYERHQEEQVGERFIYQKVDISSHKTEASNWLILVKFTPHLVIGLLKFLGPPLLLTDKYIGNI